MVEFKKNKNGQVGYAISVILIFIGFIFFGIFILANNSITSNVITQVNLPDSCSDTEVKQTWDSIFQESSDGISIIKNNSLFGGKCTEYSANKSDANEVGLVYLLYGYTKNVGGKNVSYVFAEKINTTQLYWDTFLKNVTHIENVSVLNPLKDNSFFEKYVQLRTESVLINNIEINFNKTFEMNQSEGWTSQIYLNNLSYTFSNDLSNSNYEIYSSGKISSNYNYESFNFISEEIFCSTKITCINWTNCLNNSQGRACVNSTCGVNVSYIENRSCSLSSCVPLWNWTNWTECLGNFKLRSVWDENNCGNDTNQPSTNISCIVEECLQNWNCTDWTPLTCPQDEIQKRDCNDINKCSINELIRTETKNCGDLSVKENNFVFIVVMFVVVILILGIIGLVIFLLTRKDDSEENSLNISSSTPPAIPPKINNFSNKQILPRQNSFQQKINQPNRFSNPIRRFIPRKNPPKNFYPQKLLRRNITPNDFNNSKNNFRKPL